MKVINTVGDRIKKVFEDKGITPYKLHKESGISQSTIGRILKNENEPNRSTLEVISSVLGINVNWLITGEGEMAIKPYEVDEKTNLVREERELYGKREGYITLRTNKEVIYLLEKVEGLENLVKMKDKEIEFLRKHIDELVDIINNK